MNPTTTQQSTVDLVIKFPSELMDSLRDISAMNEKDLQVLVNGYIREGILHDMPRLRHHRFYYHVKEIMQQHSIPPEALADIEKKFEW